MTQTHPITIAGRTFAVPALPLRFNRVVYPICRRLSDGDLVDRVIEAKGALACTAEEMDELAELAFQGVLASGESMDRADFDELAIAPPELLDTFFTMRYATGAWVERATALGGDVAAGEAAGVEAPPE